MEIIRGNDNTVTIVTMATPEHDDHEEEPHNKCWPWMKNAKCRVAHPIDLVDENDQRPTCLELFVKHRPDIEWLKTKLESNPLYCASKHDDLWCLRFLLSQRSHRQHALDAATSTLQFRNDHQLDDYDLRGVPVTAAALLEEHNESLPPFAHSAGKMLACYQDDETLLYSIPDLRRGVIGFLQMAQRNQPQMAATLTADDYFRAHLFFTEWKFQWTDFLTRTTGRLTKYLSIADCHGAHRGMIHKESKKLDSQAAKQMEDKYPQLLGSMVVTHAPTWIHILFAILKPLAPRRLLEKVDLIKPTHKKKDLHKLLEYVTLEQLPARYGGTLEEWPPQLDNLTAALGLN